VPALLLQLTRQREQWAILTGKLSLASILHTHAHRHCGCHAPSTHCCQGTAAQCMWGVLPLAAPALLLMIKSWHVCWGATNHLQLLVQRCMQSQECWLTPFVNCFPSPGLSMMYSAASSSTGALVHMHCCASVHRPAPELGVLCLLLWLSHKNPIELLHRWLALNLQQYHHQTTLHGYCTA
jgi:hypothetical protein